MASDGFDMFWRFLPVNISLSSHLRPSPQLTIMPGCWPSNLAAQASRFCTQRRTTRAGGDSDASCEIQWNRLGILRVRNTSHFQVKLLEVFCAYRIFMQLQFWILGCLRFWVPKNIDSSTTDRKAPSTPTAHSFIVIKGLLIHTR